jgi:glycosyltransferase involved in cell wall biosynthesis
MITILYPFKNRELFRVKNSIDSLLAQSNLNFHVVFVDYGSEQETAAEVKQLLLKHESITYLYSYNIDQPWSRSKAINIGLRQVKTEYVFIADIDIIFDCNFIELLYKLKSPIKNTYFQVGYLDEHESKILKSFDSYKIISKSIPEAQGLALFSTKSLIEVNGFDEFMHFWGAEDEDINSRLNNTGFQTQFYNDKILLLHQWHPKFEESKHKHLSIDSKLSDVFNLNKCKLRFNQSKALVKVNDNNWGNIFSQKDYVDLKLNNKQIILLNKKVKVDNLINIVLPITHSEIINIHFKKDNYQSSLSYKIKKILGIKVHEYYSLKEINDLILLQIVVHYKKHPYIYKINPDLESIDFIIKK